jgi:hypothetical protein
VTLRVAVRQIRDLVSRLIWRLELPSGFDTSATALVVESEIRSGKGLAELDRLVAAGIRVDPGRVAVAEPGPGLVAIDAGGEPSVFVGPLAVDLARDAALRDGAVEVHAVNVSGPALVRALDGFAGQPGVDVRLEGDGALGSFRLSVGAAPATAVAEPDLDDLLERGLEVPEELWDRLFALSLDVLLNVDRRPDPEEERE